MKILFAADLHLDPLIWKGLPDVRDDAHESWKQVVCAALEQNVQAVVLGGDVFDRHPPSESVRAFLEGVWLLKERGIRVLAIQGQHGHSYRLPWSSIDPYVTDLNAEASVAVGPFRLAGIDNLPPNQLQERLKALDPGVNVLVLHQMIKGMVPSFGGREIWDCDPDWVPSHVKLVLAGDYHSPVERTFRGIKFKYNGSTVMRSISEPDEKFCHIVRKDFSVEAVKLETRPVLRLLMLMEKPDEGQMKDLHGRLKEAPAGAVVHIQHNPRIPNLEGFCREANPRAHYLFKPVIVRDEIVVNEVKAPETVTLRGCLDRLLDRGKAPFLYDLIVDLLAADAPAETIAAYRQKFLEEKTDADVPTAEGGKLLPAQEA